MDRKCLHCGDSVQEYEVLCDYCLFHGGMSKSSYDWVPVASLILVIVLVWLIL